MRGVVGIDAGDATVELSAPGDELPTDATSPGKRLPGT
ncbi:MAG: hypothetical protein JWM53_1334, partial [bacterium]|nr:hypothetical protein [bacterium]